MKNLLKKTFSILIALTILLGNISVFADETAETEWANLPVFEIGRGMSGTVSSDSATEIKAHAGRRGQVQFTLTLTEDCDISVAIDGGGVFLTRPNADFPVYTFIKRFEWNEYAVISMTSSRTTGYSLISEILQEEPAPEEKHEETPAEEPAAEEKQEEATGEEQAPVEEPAAEPEEVQEEQQAPAVNVEEEPQENQATEEEKQEESQEESDKESETPMAETGTETDETEAEPLSGEENPTETTEQTETAEQPAAEEAEPEELAENSEEGQQETENTEGAANSIEIIIAKALTPEESWNGKVRNNKPTILKLDVAQTRSIHMLVEGKDVCYSVQKSDRVTEDVGQVLTDTETNRSITSWTAEAGSYLISLKAGESSFAARVAVTFMTDEQFEAWEAEQVAMEAEKNTEEETPEEKEDESENNPEETENEPESVSEIKRDIDFDFSWDTDKPKVGDTAHFKAKLTGYDDVNYSLQWQTSPDCITWTDYPGATTETIDVVITREINHYYWRLVVYVEEQQEG